MCIYTGVYQDVKINFLQGNIFTEKGVIIIKDPKNVDDYNDGKAIPFKIPLKEIQMDKNDKEKITKRFEKKKTHAARRTRKKAQKI